MAQLTDNINSRRRAAGALPPASDAAAGTVISGNVRRPMVSIAWFILLVLLLGIIFGAGALWYDLLGARKATISLLQSVDPEMRAREAWIVTQEEAMEKLETDLMSRESAVAKREKDVDAQIMALQERIKQFEDIQKDPNSPQELRALELAGIYVNMDDKKAAEILQEMSDPNEVIRILKHMKEEKVASIMAAMEVDYAAQLSRTILGRESY